MKLNYRHSLATMRLVLIKFKETICFYYVDGGPVYELKEANEKGELKQTCGFFYNATDCAEYINNKTHAKNSK